MFKVRAVVKVQVIRSLMMLRLWLDPVSSCFSWSRVSEVMLIVRVMDKLFYGQVKGLKQGVMVMIKFRVRSIVRSVVIRTVVKSAITA